MATPDGSVVIEVNMNTSQADKDLGKLKKKIEQTESDISNMTEKRDKAREKSYSLLGDLDAEKRKLQDLKDQLADFRNRSKDKTTSPTVQQNYKDAIPGVKQELEDQKTRVRAMQSEWDKLESSVERYDAKIAEATEKLEQQKMEAGTLQQQINDAAKEYEENIRKSAVSNQDIVDLNRELVSLVQQLNELEEKGITLGFQKYDATISRLAEVESRLRSYQKEITKTQAQEQREKELAQKQMDRAMRDAEALTQKMEAAAAKERAAAAEANRLKAIADNAEVSNERIVSLNKELEALKDRQADLTKAGVGAGYQEFDRNAARIAEIRRAIREYQKEMSKPVTPAGDLYNTEAAKEAEVSNQHIVDLNRELLELKQKQAALEKSGIGLGHQEYDQNAARIAEIKKELKEYQDSLVKTSAASGKMNGILGKMISSIAGSESAALKSLGTVAGSVVSKAAPALAVAAEVGSVVKSFAGKVSASLKSILSGLAKASAAVLKFGIAAAKAFSRAAMGALAFLKKVNVFPKMFSSIGKSFKRLGSIIKSALIFSVIYQGLALVRTQMAAYLRVNTEFSTALRRLQGALLTAFQPIYEVVVPALTSLINILTRAIATVTQFFAALFGKTAKQAQTNAKDLYEQAKATTAAGDAAEDASKQMASFDEINQLRENKSGGGGGGGASAETGPLFDYDYEDTPFNSWGEAFSAFLDKLLAGIPELEKSLMGFVDRLNNLAKKLYEMFTFPGVLEKVKQLGEDLADMMNRITDAIEWELIGRALGAGLNLALNFLTSFLYRYDWMNLGRHLAEFINGLVDEIDWYEFGRLLWSGFKIGLETLAGFILGLNMPELAQAASNIVKGFFDEMMNTIQRIPWFSIGAKIAEFLNSIDWYGTITSVISAIQAALLALQQMIFGFVSTLEWHEIAEQIYTAINDSLGKINWQLLGKTLGDMFIHIFDFVREVIAGINWQQIGEGISDFLTGIDWRGVADSVLGAIKAAFTASSGFFSGLLGEELKRVLTDMLITISKYTLVIGALLALSGANIPLGLGLMKVGAASLAAAAVLDWEYVSSQIQGIITTVTTVLGGALLAIGAILALSSPNHIPLGIGLMAAGAVSLATAATINWDFIPKTISGVITTALGFLSTTFLVLGAILAFSSANVPLGIGLIALGAVSLATAAAINWDILPNTIEGIVSKVAAILSVSLLVLGAILVCSGVALPLGIALIAAGAAGLVTVGALNWNAILEKLEGVWSDIQKWWNSDVKKYFTLEYWKGKGKDVIDGFLAGLNDAFEPIRKWVEEKVQWIKDKFRGATDGNGGGSYGGSASRSGYSRTAYYASPALPDISTFNIPALARGAVIPPNREFLAVLGDQKSGTNIEAPLADIENVVYRAVRAAGGVGGGNMTVVLQVEGRELGRAVVKYGGEEYKRIGVNLAEART